MQIINDSEKKMTFAFLIMVADDVFAFAVINFKCFGNSFCKYIATIVALTLMATD